MHNEFMIKNLIVIFNVAILLALAACSKNSPGDDPDRDEQDPPAKTWQEDWFDHKQVLKLQYYNKYTAIYYDEDMDTTLTWPRDAASKIWKYSWDTYEGFGDDHRLKVILHLDKYFGGHPGYYLSEMHGFQNVIDIGLNNSQWADSLGLPLDMITHEIGHIVESCAFNTLESPAYPIWGDSKWAEIFQYDVYKALGWSEKAQSWHNEKLKTSDDFPRAGTFWYRDWFYPIYSTYGETAVLVEFFRLLSENFPTKPINGGEAFTRNLTMGEFVHFWSAAASSDLKEMALTAFGPTDKQGHDWVLQLDQAKKDFPSLQY